MIRFDSTFNIGNLKVILWTSEVKMDVKVKVEMQFEITWSCDPSFGSVGCVLSQSGMILMLR